MGDDSDEQLEQRVDQLEAQLSKMLPGRRGVLKGLGAAALGGAAVGGATGGAAGQSAAGQIGTPDNRVDVFANNYDAAGETSFDSVSTDEATINNQPDEASDAARKDYADSVFAAQGYTDELLNRATGTAYQNTTGGPLQVKVIGVSQATLPAQNVRLELLVGGQSDSLSRVDFHRLDMDGADPARMWLNVTAIIPDGYWYSVSSNFGGGELLDWYEQELSGNP